MKNIFYWIIGGLVLTTTAFFIPEQSGSMWPSVISSSIVAFLYLMIFTAVWLKEIQSSAKRKAIAVTFTILFVFSIASATISYEGSERQQETLDNIRTYLERDILYNYMHEPLIKTLDDVYAEHEDERNIGRLFTARYDSVITDDNVFEYGSKSDHQTLFLYLSKVSADSVVVIGESTYLDGKEEDFTNFSGNTGRYQVSTILTSKGVDYERDN